MKRLFLLFLCLSTITIATFSTPAQADQANWDLGGGWSAEYTQPDPMYKGFSMALFGKMAEQLQAFHQAVYPALMESFGGFTWAFMTLYIVICGYGIAMGWFPDSVKQMLTSIGLVIFIQSFILASNIYSTVITPHITGFFMGLSDFFASKALGSGGMTGATDSFSVFSALDEMIFRLDGATKAIEASSSVLDFVNVKMWFAILTLTVLYSFLYGAFMAILVMGYFSLNILYLVGGICIFFAAFNKTRFIFYAWLKGIFNYGLLIVFASIVMAICIFGLNDSLLSLIDSAQRTAEVFTREYFFAVFWALVSIALILKTPDFAAQFSGASAGSTTGIAAGMGLVAGSMAKGMRGGMGPAGRFAGNLADRGLSSMPGGAGRAYSRLKGIYKGD